jgi:hypothetical protein
MAPKSRAAPLRPKEEAIKEEQLKEEPLKEESPTEEPFIEGGGAPSGDENAEGAERAEGYDENAEGDEGYDENRHVAVAGDGDAEGDEGDGHLAVAGDGHVAVAGGEGGERTEGYDIAEGDERAEGFENAEGDERAEGYENAEGDGANAEGDQGDDRHVAVAPGGVADYWAPDEKEEEEEPLNMSELLDMLGSQADPPEQLPGPAGVDDGDDPDMADGAFVYACVADDPIHTQRDIAAPGN